MSCFISIGPLFLTTDPVFIMGAPFSKTGLSNSGWCGNLPNFFPTQKISVVTTVSDVRPCQCSWRRGAYLYEMRCIFPVSVEGCGLGSLVALFPFLPSPTTNTMSQTSPKAASGSNYQPIFDGALVAYQRRTGKDIGSRAIVSDGAQVFC